MYHVNVMLAVHREARMRNHVALRALQITDPEGHVPEAAYARPHDNLKWLVFSAGGEQLHGSALVCRFRQADSLHARCRPHNQAARLHSSGKRCDQNGTGTTGTTSGTYTAPKGGYGSGAAVGIGLGPRRAWAWRTGHCTTGRAWSDACNPLQR
jgi:hypothetical protein